MRPEGPRPEIDTNEVRAERRTPWWNSRSATSRTRVAHFPSGKFLANDAWTVIAALANNLLRWTT